VRGAAFSLTAVVPSIEEDFVARMIWAKDVVKGHEEWPVRRKRGSANASVAPLIE